MRRHLRWRIILDEISFALSDQNLYDEHLHLVNPETGEIVLWTREGGIDRTKPVDLDDLDLIAIRPRDPESRPLTMTEDQGTMVFWFTMLLIPALLFANAIRVWWRRR